MTNRDGLPFVTGLDSTKSASRGICEARRAGWFDGLSLHHETDGTTVIYGSVVDQAALHGLLTKFRHLGLPLISVTQVDPTQTKGTHQ